MGPAVVRTSAASHHWQATADPASAGAAPLLLGTCHVLVADGPGVRKMEAGWTPGSVSCPIPPVARFT